MADDIREVPEQPKRPRHASLRDSAESLAEYAAMLLFALTDQDKAHQQHARECVDAWITETRLAVVRHDKKKRKGQRK